MLRVQTEGESIGTSVCLVHRSQDR
uniref:Uncharacterized protein n=1 Tax=Anguilla anguilla TaxID=7936 RepID=A0A0E9P6M7_ANGAN